MRARAFCASPLLLQLQTILPVPDAASAVVLRAPETLSALLGSDLCVMRHFTGSASGLLASEWRRIACQR